ncbi:MAG: 3-oxoacyl-[acyl-carrier-protein] reductase [Saprospiraceae bacterium]|nr:3-oxoacyl-[acyl-carrier-protein] reductase [Saprospiraceae bacterium]
MSRLKGRVAIVTGGASGIGKATAVRFAQEGAKIAIWDLNEEKGAEAVKEIESLGGEATFYKVNTVQLQSVETAAASVIEDYEQIDILINNAGITRDATLIKMTEEQFDTVIDVNLKGVYNCTKAVAPYMMERKYGRIVTAASVVGLYGNFGQTNYVATKSAVIGMTKVWARELGRKGITANAVAPGFIATEMMKTIPEKVLEGMKSKTPAGRLGLPEEVANAYLFLASDEAAFINGATLSVDGGMVA